MERTQGAAGRCTLRSIEKKYGGEIHGTAYRRRMEKWDKAAKPRLCEDPVGRKRVMTQELSSRSLQWAGETMLAKALESHGGIIGRKMSKTEKK